MVICYHISRFCSVNKTFMLDDNPPKPSTLLAGPRMSYYIIFLQMDNT